TGTSFGWSISTNPPGTFGGSTGLYAPGITYSVASCTDGTSNTIAYAEQLVADTTATAVSMDGGRALKPPSTYRANRIYTPNAVTKVHDAWTNQPATLAGLQVCATAMQSAGALIQDTRGYRWAMGITGYTMFNTIQTPNDSLYRFGGCRPFD